MNPLRFILLKKLITNYSIECIKVISMKDIKVENARSLT